MKTSSLLITTALVAPATVLFGAALPVTLGISAVAGVLSVAFNDYGTRRLSYADATLAKRSAEKLPLAA